MSERADQPARGPVNPPRRKRGDFKLVGITMPPWMIFALKRESVRRQEAGQTDWEVSAIVREAVAGVLTQAPAPDSTT